MAWKKSNHTRSLVEWTGHGCVQESNNMFTNSLSVAPYFKIKSRSYILYPEKQRRQNPESTSCSFECSCCLVVLHGLNSPNHLVKKKCQKCDNHPKKELLSSFHFHYTLWGRIQGGGGLGASHPPPPPLWGRLSLKVRKGTRLSLGQLFLRLLRYRSVRSAPLPPPLQNPGSATALGFPPRTQK